MVVLVLPEEDDQQVAGKVAPVRAAMLDITFRGALQPPVLGVATAQAVERASADDGQKGGGVFPQRVCRDSVDPFAGFGSETLGWQRLALARPTCYAP